MCPSWDTSLGLAWLCSSPNPSLSLPCTTMTFPYPPKPAIPVVRAEKTRMFQILVWVIFTNIQGGRKASSHGDLLPAAIFSRLNLWCLSGWGVYLIPFPSRGKRESAFTYFKNFLIQLENQFNFYHYFLIIPAASLHRSPSTQAKLTVPHSSKPHWRPSSHSYAHSEHHKSAQISFLPRGNVFFSPEYLHC